MGQDPGPSFKAQIPEPLVCLSSVLASLEGRLRVRSWSRRPRLIQTASCPSQVWPLQSCSSELLFTLHRFSAEPLCRRTGTLPARPPCSCPAGALRVPGGPSGVSCTPAPLHPAHLHATPLLLVPCPSEGLGPGHLPAAGARAELGRTTAAGAPEDCMAPGPGVGPGESPVKGSGG